MILVTGATGHVGNELVRHLARRGHPVRALVRDPKKLDVPGVEAVAGDLNRPETLASAAAGARGAFLLSGYNDLPGTLALLRGAGVERAVLLSSQSAADSDERNAVARYHIQSEQDVRDSGLAWTFLRPSSFMSNALRWLPQLRAGDVVREPFAHARLATVDPEDIAAVAATALLSDDDSHEGQAYRLTGPAALSAEERVAILGLILNRPLRLEAQSDADARAEMSRTMPAAYVDAFFDFFTGGRYDESTVHPTVQQVTGRPARSFAEWVMAHTQEFGSPEGGSHGVRSG